MHMILRGLVPLAALTACLSAGAAPDVSDHVRHELEVRLDPAAHGIVAEDAIVLPGALLREGRIRFVLHGALTVECPDPECVVEPRQGVPDRTRYGINEEGSGAPDVPLREYVVQPGPRVLEGAAPLRLSYRGEIFHPLVAEGEEYARSFSRSPGIIDAEGVVLSGSSWWLPVFGDDLVTFRLTVDLPPEWDAVSQGARTLHESVAGRRRVTWDSPHPMDEVYLIAARFSEYSRPAGEVTAYAFLRGPDPNLAAKYLEATAQYLEMYRKLIGPYPYGKFALVENFWDTGYGMPSFTLLGSRIIRFPFILHSSYPHEILHNWWGNSVFVDYATGNWCEGLTAYLADHLVKEGQGQGAEYRRDALKKYRNFVRDEQDFALSEFRARHSSATEAVGYGKSLMLWHMLRRRIGDDAFASGLRRFYRDNAFRRAGFGDLEAAFSAVAEEDLAPLFRQWVERSGAPELAIEDLTTTRSPEGAVRLTLALRQLQDGEPYRLSVPLAVTLEGQAAPLMHTLELDGALGALDLQLPARPLRVDVDPEFDLFRRLDPFEIPPSLGQLFGAERVTLVLPDSPDPLTPSDWQGFAERWSGRNGEQLQVVREGELRALPTDRAVWILGRGNRWAGVVASALDGFGAGVDGRVVRAGDAELPLSDHSFAFAVRHPEDPELALGWIGADRADALEGLARKLPHYGKYSFVVFAGAEPTNVAKGQWPVLGSPLVRLLGTELVAAATPPAREPLARLEPVFDPVALMSHVRRLAAPELSGRGVGSTGLDNAANYVARFFEQAGLTPGGEDGGWFQSWTEPDGPGGEPVTLRNVIGVLPGTREEWAGQSVVLGAHYDHLGDGWPDVHAGDEGRTHPGADDNASGVAVLLELARLLGGQLEPPRTLVFVAFSAEEWGLRGSRHFVKSEQRWPVSKALAMINLDTVGRLNGKPITVFGTGTATEWVHIVRGIGFTTGVQGRSVADDPGGSDQKSFHEAGVPAVQLFSGAHSDYHRPGDTPDRIDANGLIDVAVFAREALVYLSEREEPLTSTLSAAPSRPSAAAPAPASGRRVSLGTLPDFGFPGPGVKLEQVMPGTPAEAAGLLAGDLIVSIDGREIDGLRTYAAVLRERAPGDVIRITFTRDGAERTVSATLAAR